MKIALVTGSSRGLGKSEALHIAQKGIGVIVTYNSKEAEANAVVAEIEKAGGQAIALKLDVSQSSSFKDFAGQVKAGIKTKWNRDTFDFLVNNAGTSLHASFAETTEVQFDQLVDVHFKGTYFLTQTLLPLIADGGRILNTSSGLARFSFAGSSAYAAVKGAVEVLTRYMAVELGSRRISVNTIAPGAIETDFSGGMVRDNPQMNKAIASQTALGRVGLPDDVGGVVATLLTEETRWLNGQRIEIAGGMLL